MGYYSQLALANDFHGNRPDTSFPTPTMILQWRIADLNERLLEVKKTDKSLGESRIPKEILHYIFPEHLFRVKDVEKAIEIALEKIQAEQNEEKKAYKEEFPEERLSLPRVVIIPAVATIEKNGSKEKEGIRHGNPVQKTTSYKTM